MRLLTHNLLACHARTCNAPTNFPLQFKDCTRLEVVEAEYNADFLMGFRSKLDWKALVSAAKEVRKLCRLRKCRRNSDTELQLGDTSLPEEEPASLTQEPAADDEFMDDDVLKKLHHVLLEVRAGGLWFVGVALNFARQIHVQDGNMVCPSCAHVYPIKDGIPNMVSGPTPTIGCFNAEILRQLLAEHELRR